MVVGRLVELLAQERVRELHAAAAAHGGSTRTAFASPVAGVTLRYAVPADRRRLRRLATLHSAPAPGHRTLVAEVDGTLRAALPLDVGGPLVDPVSPCGELVELLRLRAAQVERLD